MKRVSVVVTGLVALMVSGANLYPAETAAETKQETSPWAVTIAAGANLTRGNSETMLYNGSVVAEYKQNPHEFRMGAEGNYGETTTTNHPGGEKKADENVANSDVFANYKFLFDKADYVYADGKIANDDIADLEYRLIIGPGLGRYFIKSDTQMLFFETGASYIKQKQAGIEDETYALRVAEKYEWKLSATAKIWEAVEYMPAFEDFQNYLLNAEAGVEAAINSRVSLRLVAQDKYNSRPAAGKDQNDFTLIASLVCKL